MPHRVVDERFRENRQKVFDKIGTDLTNIGNRLDSAEVKRSTGPGTNLATRTGQNNQQNLQVTTAQTDQALVKPRSTTGRGINRDRSATRRFEGSAPGLDDPTLSNVAARAKAGIGTGKRLPKAAETERQAIDRLALKRTGEEVSEPVVEPRGIVRTPSTTGRKRKTKKSFNILNFQGIENIFNSAGELAAFFASPEFQKQQRINRGKAATTANRLAELKGLDSSIKALSGALGDVELSDDEGLKSTLSTQLADAVRQREEISSGAGGTVRQRLDTSTAEGFAITLKDLGFSDDETKQFTNRRFAGAA